MNKLLILGLACLLTVIHQGPAAAAEKTADQAGLVIYRDKESSWTRSANYSVFIDGSEAGRLKNDLAVATRLPAGEYRVSSSLDRSSHTVLVVPEGETVYVKSTIRGRSDGPTVEFSVIKGQVAHNQ